MKRGDSGYGVKKKQKKRRVSFRESKSREVELE